MRRFVGYVTKKGSLLSPYIDSAYTFETHATGFSMPIRSISCGMRTQLWELNRAERKSLDSKQILQLFSFENIFFFQFLSFKISNSITA